MKYPVFALAFILLLLGTARLLDNQTADGLLLWAGATAILAWYDGDLPWSKRRRPRERQR